MLTRIYIYTCFSHRHQNGKHALQHREIPLVPPLSVFITNMSITALSMMIGWNARFGSFICPSQILPLLCCSELSVARETKDMRSF
ncbi:hypothetical protein CEXT_556051 [Caerostris extrusa]|uniref:Uncharacterized protein n=1 Tax=Caerostris extrusa TaxID=172846 RepID=A0AAV4UFK5_CAEEX|nr:hypothetical protein CEXT_556051 [Caerostris extrusa]